jgi:hypothetical protein
MLARHIVVEKTKIPLMLQDRVAMLMQVQQTVP